MTRAVFGDSSAILESLGLHVFVGCILRPWLRLEVPFCICTVLCSDQGLRWGNIIDRSWQRERKNIRHKRHQKILYRLARYQFIDVRHEMCSIAGSRRLPPTPTCRSAGPGRLPPPATLLPLLCSTQPTPSTPPSTRPCPRGVYVIEGQTQQAQSGTEFQRMKVHSHIAECSRVWVDGVLRSFDLLMPDVWLSTRAIGDTSADCVCKYNPLTIKDIKTLLQSSCAGRVNSC